MLLFYQILTVVFGIIHQTSANYCVNEPYNILYHSDNPHCYYDEQTFTLLCHHLTNTNEIYICKTGISLYHIVLFDSLYLNISFWPSWVHNVPSISFSNVEFGFIDSLASQRLTVKCLIFKNTIFTHDIRDTLIKPLAKTLLRLEFEDIHLKDPNAFFSLELPVLKLLTFKNGVSFGKDLLPIIMDSLPHIGLIYFYPNTIECECKYDWLKNYSRKNSYNSNFFLLYDAALSSYIYHLHGYRSSFTSPRHTRIWKNLFSDKIILKGIAGYCMDISPSMEVNLANASLCFSCYKGFCQGNTGCQEYNDGITPKCRCRFEYIKVKNSCRSYILKQWIDYDDDIPAEVDQKSTKMTASIKTLTTTIYTTTTSDSQSLSTLQKYVPQLYQPDKEEEKIIIIPLIQEQCSNENSCAFSQPCCSIDYDTRQIDCINLKLLSSIPNCENFNLIYDLHIINSTNFIADTIPNHLYHIKNIIFDNVQFQNVHRMLFRKMKIQSLMLTYVKLDKSYFLRLILKYISFTLQTLILKNVSNLSGNIDKDIGYLSQLRYLRFESTLIGYFYRSSLQLYPKLKMLDIYGNSILCNCSHDWLKILAKETVLDLNLLTTVNMTRLQRSLNLFKKQSDAWQLDYSLRVTGSCYNKLFPQRHYSLARLPLCLKCSSQLCHPQAICSNQNKTFSCTCKDNMIKTMDNACIKY